MLINYYYDISIQKKICLKKKSKKLSKAYLQVYMMIFRLKLFFADCKKHQKFRILFGLKFCYFSKKKDRKVFALSSSELTFFF